MSSSDLILDNKGQEVRKQRHKAGIRAIVAVVLAFAVLFFSNKLSSIIYLHYQVESGAAKHLSEASLSILEGVTGKIRLSAVFERTHPFRLPTALVLNEFTKASRSIPSLEIESVCFDASRDLTQVEALMRPRPDMPVNSVLVCYGDEYIVVDEFDMAGPVSSQGLESSVSEIERSTHYYGEWAIARAIRSVSRVRNAPVYFLEGHGEIDPLSHHPVYGGSVVASALEQEGFPVRKILLTDTTSIPQDCGVLVIAGPQTMLPQREIEKISSYLANGGRLLVLVDNALASGLAPMLSVWGISLENTQQGMRRELSTRTSSLNASVKHPVTSRLQGVFASFGDPCIVRCSPHSVSSIDVVCAELLNVQIKSTKENAPVAVATEMRDSGVAAPRIRPRMIVVGDSDWISNGFLRGTGSGGNEILSVCAVRWLSGVATSSIPLASNPYILSTGITPDGGWTQLAIALCVALPLAVLVFGVFIWVPVARFR